MQLPGLERELDLRRRGFVPVTSYDAASPTFLRALPRCRVVEPLNPEEHGRLVWSHPGPSGLDPRAVGPLALVRVADGLRAGALDPPMTLGQAVRWLLEGDVDQWLLRPRHRALVWPCLWDSLDGCLTHRVLDLPAQRVADALGDPSAKSCVGRSTSQNAAWAGVPVSDPHLLRLTMRALGVTLRLADWARAGLRGSGAWELARHNVLECCLDEWEGGLSREQVIRWCAQERPRQVLRQRDRGTPTDLPVVLPPPVPSSVKGRGMNGWQAWGMSRHGQGHRVLTCRTCGAQDLEQPCRTCRTEGPPVTRDREWSSFQDFGRLHSAFADHDAGRTAVACGVPDCA